MCQSACFLIYSLIVRLLYFWMRIYIAVLLVQLKHLTGSTANTLLEYIQRNLPEGMAMKVTRVSVKLFLGFYVVLR